MSLPHDLPALHLLNTVFAGVTGQDLYLAEQLKAGIEQALAEQGGVVVATAAAGAALVTGVTPAAFAAAVQALQRRFAGGEDDLRHGFAHYDAAQGPAAPDSLWTREQVLAALRRLAPYRRRRCSSRICTPRSARRGNAGPSAAAPPTARCSIFSRRWRSRASGRARTSR